MVRWRSGPRAGPSLLLAFCAVLLCIDTADGGQTRSGPAAGPVARYWRDQDRAIGDLVVIRLAASSSLAGLDIGVEATRGVVTLRGTVPTNEAEERAVRIALWTPGVQDVENQLQVDPKAAPPARVELPDGDLAKRVAMKLATEVFRNAHAEDEWLSGWAVEGNGWEIDVDVDDGDVSLGGEVPHFRTIRLAVEAARAIPGVRTVRAELLVRDEDFGWRHGPYGPGGPFSGRPAYGPWGPGYPGYRYYGPYPPSSGGPPIGYPWAQ